MITSTTVLSETFLHFILFFLHTTSSQCSFINRDINTVLIKNRKEFQGNCPTTANRRRLGIEIFFTRYAMKKCKAQIAKITKRVYK